jgi:uncharacterized protein
MPLPLYIAGLRSLPCAHHFHIPPGCTEVNSRPTIWVLKGLRQGDTAQAMALALRIGGDIDARVEGKPLGFNRLHALPNWISGPGVRHLTADAKALLRAPWPDLVVATGRRTAPVALWIKQQSAGHTKVVQIGRPRMALNRFDLVVSSPQYDVPTAVNVVTVPLPFALPKTVAMEDLQHFAQVWAHLPKPWVLGVVGGSKFPLRLNAHDLADFGCKLSALAKKCGGSVIVLDSPRSPRGALQTVAQNLSQPHWVATHGASPNPYHAGLRLCAHLVVTSDSVSMISEMLLAGKSVWAYRLPRSPLAPSWSGQSGVMGCLETS